ncbi:MAG TPA: AsmA family protein [Hyphomicrobiaceae bacterium]|nr:AsmA family protein [Hyphomicrobiaceae bacterium]
MNNLLIAIAVFVITVVGALFAVPYFIDWNSYRSTFEEEAKSVIGRDVEVDGNVTLHLLPTPYFRVEKVRIADTSATLTEHFFKTESLSIKLSIAPLLRGVVEANEIEFQRPVLRAALDANGGWNWQSFAQALGSTGYVPANVTLTSLKVVDGVLAFHGADGIEHARLDAVNGELSAPALDGPYRFRGTFTSGGSVRDIRIGTAAPEADGKVPLRVALRLLDTGASYVLDARAADIMGKARIEGNLVARLPVAAPAPGGSARRVTGGSDEEPKIDHLDTPLEVKAALKADTTGATFSDLTLTFEQGDRPQTITGTARSVWRNPVTLDMDLSSRWLDLDRLAGAAEGAAPAASVAKLAAWVRDLLPAEGLARVSISIDQANLAGEAIGPLRLALARSANKLEIAELRTALPGGSRVDFKGGISGAADALAFKGDLGIKGASASRLVGWATSDGLSLAGDGPFDLRANITVDASQVAVRDLAGSLAGTVLQGAGRYKWAGRPELALALEGPKLDARGLLPANLNLFDALAALARTPAGKQDRGAPEAGGAVWRALQSDFDLRLKAGQLVTGERTYRDFSTTVVTKGGDIKQLALRLAGDDGYNLELEGRVDALATLPKGTVRGHVVAETPASIGPLAGLLGVPDAFRPGESRERAMAPLRLAGTLTFGARTATSADLTLDGEGNGAAVRVAARFDGGSGGWRSGRADLTASVDAGDAAKVAGFLFPGGAPPGRSVSLKPGRILVRAAGIPAEGLTSVASVEAADLALNFRGQVVVAEAGTKAEGDLEARASSGTALAALAGLTPALRADGVPINARLKLAVDAGAISMDKLALQLGGTRLSGKIALSGTDRRRIDASLSTDDISVGTLLNPLLDLRFGAASAAEAVLLGRPNPWPDEPFSASALGGFEGQIRLSCRRLTLAEGMALERAQANILLKPGKVEAKEITGAALGGEFKATLSIEKVPAGADVRGTLGFGIALEEVRGARPPRASGPMKGRIEFAGRGVSPRAVMSALQGEGTIAFGETQLPGVAPGAILPAIEAALKVEAGKLAPTLRRTLAAGLATSSLPLEHVTVGLDIVDGQVRSKPLLVETSEGRTSGSARLDLKGLTLDSQWRLEAKLADAAAAAKLLPAVTVSYQAPLATLSAAEPQIDISALEQEISARKIERDMEELERLRRLNEADPLRKPPEPAVPAQAVPPGPLAPVPPFGQEVRPGAPG